MPILSVAGNGAVNVAYKEFGVRLRFRPTIAGDMIRLHVRPEVSALDFGNGITAQGFRIPALITRYAETEVELRDGQSFAIAGLLDHVGQEDMAGDSVPEPDSDHWQPVQDQGEARRAHRADGADHAATGARAESRRGAAAADDHQAAHGWPWRRLRHRRGAGRRAAPGLVDAPPQPSAPKKDAPAAGAARKVKTETAPRHAAGGRINVSASGERGGDHDHSTPGNPVPTRAQCWSIRPSCSSA